MAELATFPYYEWHHALIVPLDHPLLNETEITLEKLSAYPLITYHEGFTGRGHIDQAFANAGIVPDIVLSAIDAYAFIEKVSPELSEDIVKGAISITTDTERAI